MKKITLILAVAILSTTGHSKSAKPQANMSIDKLYAKCEGYMDSKKIRFARQCCNRIKVLYSESPLGFICLSEAYFWQRNYLKALEMLQGAQNKNTTGEEACHLNWNYVYIYDKIVDYKNVTKSCQEAIQACAKYPDRVKILKHTLKVTTKKIKTSPNIKYEQQLVNGDLFLVGTEGNKQVFVRLQRSGGLQAIIIYTNLTASSIEIQPNDVQVIATVQPIKQENPGKIPLWVYSTEEYEKKLRAKQTLGAMLFGFASGVSNTIATTTTSRTYGYTSSGQTFYGSTTTANPGLATALSQMQISSFTNQQATDYASLTSNLLRPHLLPAHTSHGGVVHIKHKRAISYKVIVPFGAQDFTFSFQLNKNYKIEPVLE